MPITYATDRRKGLKSFGDSKVGKRNGQGTHAWPNGKKYVAVNHSQEVVEFNVLPANITNAKSAF